MAQLAYATLDLLGLEGGQSGAYHKLIGEIIDL